MTEAETARIRIVRSVRFLWGARAFSLVLDGSVIGRIRNGRSAEFEVPSGNHEVELQVGSARSQSLALQLSGGETVHLRCDGGDIRTWLSRAFKDQPPITLAEEPEAAAR